MFLNNQQGFEAPHHELHRSILSGFRAALGDYYESYLYKWRSPADWPYEWEVIVFHPSASRGVKIRVDGEHLIVDKTHFELVDPCVEEKVVEAVRQYFVRQGVVLI